MTVDIDLVVPTIGRPSLDVLLSSLSWSVDPERITLTIVDDRPADEPPQPKKGCREKKIDGKFTK